VKVFRAVAARRQGGLLVAIDGDDKGVTTRKSELEEALKAQAALPRAADEAIAVCVPTWSIETWLAWLCGWEHVDESTPYKAHAAYQQAARRGEIDTRRALDAWMSGPRSGEAERVPSLAEGRRETTRLPL
jgi:hypothetical protein